MRTRYHGEPVAAEEAKPSREWLKMALAPGAPPTIGFMFPDLVSNPKNKLPQEPETIVALRALGVALAEFPGDADSPIPAAYTYFGQFIDHDITNTDFAALVSGEVLEEPNFAPIPPDALVEGAKNLRTKELDLESLYEGAAIPATNPDGSMRLGLVSQTPAGAPPTIPTADKEHDLPRLEKSTNDDIDRKAEIGDPRNDENLLVAQLHVAFLRAHNAILKRPGFDREGTRRAMRRRYQWAVLHDFLPRVCEPATIEAVLRDGATAWPVHNKSELFMPVEFAGAAYRFGHSMVRAGYSHNSSFPGAPFFLFFTFTALSGNILPFPDPNNPDQPLPPLDQQPRSLPDNWIIDWSRFFSEPGLPQSQNPARRLDTQITPPLAQLPDPQGFPIATVMGKLASRNLLRGYLLGLPTGQAVANKLGAPVLSPETLAAALPPGAVDTIGAAWLFTRTPLWFYLLAEAGDPAGADGKHLGPVGSRIVAETLWNMAKFDEEGVISKPPTADELATGEFTLKGIVRIGLDAKLPPLATGGVRS